MKYVDWVQLVATGFISVWRSKGPATRGVRISEVLEEMQIPRDDLSEESVRDALTDLEQLGLLEDAGSPMGRDGKIVRPSQEGRKLDKAPLRTLWPQLFERHLDDDQLEFLSALSQLSEERLSFTARLLDVTGQSVVEHLGRNWSDPDTLVWAYRTFEELEALGLASGHAASGGFLSCHATYGGLVVATEQRATEAMQLLERLLADGETTNVDFKRELNLSRDREKAEFVRDVLALANSQLSGDRYLVIGVSDDGAEYTDASGIGVERLEQILGGWASAIPPLTLMTAVGRTHPIALLEVGREPRQLPYVATKTSSKLEVGVVYVRHGRHTQRASDEEEADIRREGDDARRR